MIQGSSEWFAARCGRVTASRITDVMAKTKTGYGAGRKNYMAQLIVERLTGQVADSFSNAAMIWGIETEPQARDAYIFLTDSEVKETGFVLHPLLEMAGASPDGLVGDDGLIEIKCMNTANHIEYLLGGSIPGKYIKQMMFQMACTSRLWCDYVSFDPRLPADLQIKIERVDRDDESVLEIESAVHLFSNELNDKILQLKQLGQPDKAVA